MATSPDLLRGPIISGDPFVLSKSIPEIEEIGKKWQKTLEQVTSNMALASDSQRQSIKDQLSYIVDLIIEGADALKKDTEIADKLGEEYSKKAASSLMELFNALTDDYKVKTCLGEACKRAFNVQMGGVHALGDLINIIEGLIKPPSTMPVYGNAAGTQVYLRSMAQACLHPPKVPDVAILNAANNDNDELPTVTKLAPVIAPMPVEEVKTAPTTLRGFPSAEQPEKSEQKVQSPQESPAPEETQKPGNAKKYLAYGAVGLIGTAGAALTYHYVQTSESETAPMPSVSSVINVTSVKPQEQKKPAPKPEKYAVDTTKDTYTRDLQGIFNPGMRVFLTAMDNAIRKVEIEKKPGMSDGELKYQAYTQAIETGKKSDNYVLKQWWTYRGKSLERLFPQSGDKSTFSCSIFSKETLDDKRACAAGTTLGKLPDPGLVAGFAVEIDPVKNQHWAIFRQKYDNPRGAQTFYRNVQNGLVSLTKKDEKGNVPCQSRINFRECAYQQLNKSVDDAKIPHDGSKELIRQQQTQKGTSDLDSVIDSVVTVYRDKAATEEKQENSETIPAVDQNQTPAPTHSKVEKQEKQNDIPAWAQKGYSWKVTSADLKINGADYEEKSEQKPSMLKRIANFFSRA